MRGTPRRRTLLGECHLAADAASRTEHSSPVRLREVHADVDCREAQVLIEELGRANFFLTQASALSDVTTSILAFSIGFARRRPQHHRVDRVRDEAVALGNPSIQLRAVRLHHVHPDRNPAPPQVARMRSIAAMK